MLTGLAATLIEKGRTWPTLRPCQLTLTVKFAFPARWAFQRSGQTQPDSIPPVMTLKQ